MAVSVAVQLTTRCNLRCAHCYVGSAGDDLPLGRLTRVADEAATVACDSLEFTGGEPTLHPHFPDILRILEERGLSFSLVTNGWHFEELFPVLRPYREHLRSLSFSLDGPDEATHDSVRGAGSFRRVLAAARLCTREGIPFGLRLTVAPAALARLEAVRQLAGRMGAAALMLMPLLPTPRMAEAGLLPTPQELAQVSAWVCARRAHSGPRLVLTVGFFALEVARPCLSLAGEFLMMTTRGDASFCCHLADYGGSDDRSDLLGNLDAISLAEAARRARVLGRALAEEKEARRHGGELGVLDHHPCWYCLKRFGKVEWLREFPGSPWAQDLLATARARGAPGKRP